jgi:hypothetical protein
MFSGRSGLASQLLMNNRRQYGTRKRVILFGITKAGLGTMTLAVVALWICIALESSTRHHANAEVQVSLQQLRRLRQDSAPAAAPAPWFRSHRPASS